MNPKEMPTELLNELFGSLPLEKAFGLLAKMLNGLLARNVQTMINGIKEIMKENKWNIEDCGQSLAILPDENIVQHSGPNDCLSVRANLPIPTINLPTKNSLISFYYEVEILNIIGQLNIDIGFCGQQFNLEGNGLEFMEIVVWQKGEIWVDKSNTKIGNGNELFINGDIVGHGIINSSKNSSMKCFVTYNGEFLGKAEISPRFAKSQLFPAVTLCRGGDSIRANFGKKQWSFKEFDKLFQH